MYSVFALRTSLGSSGKVIAECAASGSYPHTECAPIDNRSWVGRTLPGERVPHSTRRALGCGHWKLIRSQAAVVAQAHRHHPSEGGPAINVPETQIQSCPSFGAWSNFYSSCSDSFSPGQSGPSRQLLWHGLWSERGAM